MRNFWTVMKFEFILIWRSWGIRLTVLAMIVIGALAADNNRNQPWGSWGQIVFCGLFLAIILTVSTGNQINRDRERKLDGVVFSTPVATLAYVLGKYCAALFSLLGLASFSLLVAVLVDQFYSVPQRVFFLSPVFYPSFGPQPYVISWLWLIVVPVIFGATLMFAGITLTRGKRLVATIVALMVWLIPLFAAPSQNNLFFDISAISFISGSDQAVNFAFQYNLYSDAAPSPQLIQQVMHLSLAEIPPTSLLSVLLLNRLLFLGISIALLSLTIFGVQRARRRA